MPNWFYFLLVVLLALGMLLTWFYHWAHDRGYEAGMDDSLNFSRYVDDVLSQDHKK